MRRTRLRRWASSAFAVTYFAWWLSRLIIFCLSFLRACATSCASTPTPNFLGCRGVAEPEGDVELRPEGLVDDPRVGAVELDADLPLSPGRDDEKEGLIRLVKLALDFIPLVTLWMVWRSMPMSPIRFWTSCLGSAAPKSFLKSAVQLRKDSHQLLCPEGSRSGSPAALWLLSPS